MNANVCKTSYTSLVDGFMRLVCQKDNPNKKTLIDIPYTLCYHWLSVYNPSCRQYHLIKEHKQVYHYPCTHSGAVVVQ